MNLAVNGGLVALTIGLTQLLKKYLPEKYVPLGALAIGVGLALAVSGISTESALIGIVIGLSASGLYDQKKAVE